MGHRLVGIALALLVARGAFACSCISLQLSDEIKYSALVFAGHVARIDKTDDGMLRVTFTVYQSWRRRAAEEVAVDTAPSGASCGYPVEPGGDYLIFAKRIPDRPYLRIGLCSHNTPLICAPQQTLKKLGRPAVRYRPLPDFSRWGTNEQPATMWNLCGTPPVPPGDPNEGLPKGVWISDFVATVYDDGSVHDVRIKLTCLPYLTEQCTPERENETRARIESWRYKPAQRFGRPVAYKIEMHDQPRPWGR